jgi:hypothetical protein
MTVKITKEKLEDIGSYIIGGMSEKEACILSDISVVELTALKERNETVRDFLEKKKIKFKYNHLKEIQKNKSEKNSQWLLEKLRPDEFGPRSRQSDAPTINIISQIMKEIQNDNEPLVVISRSTRTGDQPDESDARSGQRAIEALN